MDEGSLLYSAGTGARRTWKRWGGCKYSRNAERDRIGEKGGGKKGGKGGGGGRNKLSAIVLFGRGGLAH